MKWDYSCEPLTTDGGELYDQDGWYAVLIMFDVSEGAFPAAAQWHGDSWSRRGVVAFGSRCATRERAEELAIEHDPDFQK